MGKSKDYIITSLKTSLNQLDKKVFTEASNVRVRGGYAPYTVLESKKGDVENKEDFPKFPFGRYKPYNIIANPIAKWTFDTIPSPTPRIPTSITAGANLIHWWKLTDDPASGSAEDYGTSGSAATNLAVVDASTTTGPTSLGSPSAFSFDGVNDIIKTQIIDASGTKNSIADLMDSEYYTITFWMKDNASLSTEVYWTTSGYWTSNTLRDGGQGFFNDELRATIYWKPASATKHAIRECNLSPPDPPNYCNTGWKHYAIVTDLRTVSGDDSVGIGYVDGVANPDTTLQDGNPHYSSYVVGAKNYWFSIGGFASGSLGAGQQWAPIDVCDFRMYDRVLTPTEITTIAAGDW